MSKRSLILILSLVLMSFGIGVAHSSALRFRHFTDMDGLSSNTVRCVYQDNMGYIWAGTNGGLNRFNSYHFTKFYTVKQDSTSLGNSNIYSIADESPTSRGRVWIGAVNGIYIFDNASGCFSHLPIVIGERELSPIIFSMTPDHNGNMWIATLGEGLLRYNLETKSFTQYDRQSHPQIFERNTVAKIIIDSDRNVWVGVGGRYICRYNAEIDDFAAFRVEDSITHQPISRISTIYEDMMGNIWVAGLSGDLYLFDRSSNQFMRNMPDFACDRIRSIIERKPGLLLLGSNQGLVSFDVRTRRFTMEDSGRTGKDYGLNDTFIYSLEKDNDGGIWIGTYYGGISYMPSSNDAFFSPEIPSACGNIISCFCEDANGKIWIGSDNGGLSLYDPETQSYERRVIDSSVENLNIHSLLIHDNCLWIGTVTRGLYRMNLRSGQVRRIYVDRAEQEDIDIYSLFCDSRGTLWVGTTNSVCRYNEHTQRLEKAFETSYNSRVTSICEDEFNDVWFATNGRGMLRYKHSNQLIEPFNNNIELSQYPFINTLSADGDKIWIGTAGNGLLLYDITNNRLTQEQDLTTYGVSSIFKIIPSSNELWITTNNGLINYSYSLSDKHIVRYASDDGLSTNIFNLNSGFKSSTGYIYVGSNNGIDRFYPYDLKQLVQHSDVEVLVTNFSIAGKQFGDKLSYDAAPEDVISVRARRLSVALSFIALNYSSPQRTIYRYRLENFDDDWIETSPYVNLGERRVTYTNLPPNTYRFQVCASRNGEHFSAPTTFEFRVLRPWWMTRFMIVVYALAAIALILGIIYLFSRNLDKQHREYVDQLTQRKDLEILKAKFERFTDRVAEFYMPLSLILASAEKVLHKEALEEEMRKDADMIYRNCSKLIKLVDSVSESKSLDDRGLSTPPLDADAGAVASADEEQAPDILQLEPADGESGAMLLVDNDSDFTDFCVRYFSSRYTVDTVTSGGEAMARLADKHFDIVLIEWTVENMSGSELCKAIRSDKMIDDTPIIVLTNEGSAKIKSDALAAGADFCLEKWVSPEFAARQIRSIIRSRQELRMKYSRMPYINSGRDDKAILENRFMVQVNAYVMDNIANSAITAEDMASAVNMSRTLFFTRIKQITGQTPNEYLRTTRLKRAAELLAGDNKLRVTEICYMVGFSSTSYFAKCFQAEYGVLPNQYIEQHRK